MRLFLLGDVHGRLRWLDDYVFPVAKGLGADAIVQLGDYGYWEHQLDGVLFNDGVMDACARYDLPFYFLRGNHDNLAHLLKTYGDAEVEDPHPQGFLQIRPRLYYIPDGWHWTWGSCTFRAFGGAYSLDKALRLETEQKRRLQRWAKETARRAAGRPAKAVIDPAGELWFPEEQLTDEQWKDLLGEEKPGPVDVLLSHDKPRMASHGDLHLKDDPECRPNQQWLQRAITLHTPKLHLHGHLHHRYSCSVRSSGDSWTTVHGLSCDWDAAPRFWRPTDAWALLDIDEDGIALQFTAGNHPSLEPKTAVALKGRS